MASTAALVLFDIDGTLLRAGDPAHQQALLDAFKEVYGQRATLDGIQLGGALDSNIVRALLARHGINRPGAHNELARVMALMGERYEQMVVDVDLRQRLLPGVATAVDTSDVQGWAAGVLTGNAHSVARVKLEKSGLGRLMSPGAFGDDAIERAHLVDIALDAAREPAGIAYQCPMTVLVGDTPADIAAARASGSRVVAVATGRWDAESLARHEPDAVLPDMSDAGLFVDAVERALGVR